MLFSISLVLDVFVLTISLLRGYIDDDYEAKYEPDPYGEEAGPNARVWRGYIDEADAYDHEMVEGWKDTVDMLLVFAGLFSAVVTTFVAQTYSPTTRRRLQLVALQRAAAQGLPASDVPVSPLNTTVTFTSAISDRVVNGFWFMSLALSLSTALFCILVKQWAQNYTSAISGPLKERALLRQMCFEGVGTWYVREIVGILPFFLHASLLLFFAGLVIFL
ncbi:uncharacterized protein STEHIDRAFT_51672, partial [Stereum hirsutum FP-91666 SS1]|uniref:uncharacterized protein n=1 Tax=Stereum hirsutum (strain FP-91666) TaxID=721885 RepID=UPI000440F6D1